MTVSPKRLAAAAFLLAAITSVALLIAPVYSGGHSGSATLMQVNGAGRTLFGLAMPLGISAFGFLSGGVRTAAAVLLVLFVFVAGGSIGLFYIPAALALALAAVLDRR
jgi:hypothetical protein